MQHRRRGPPAQPTTPGLVQDCSTLLTAQPTLEGSNGDLDWSSDTPITGWEGLRVSNTTQRVTMLLLTDKGLDGAIPPILGRLQDLRRIDLDENDLTGPVPAELGSLRKLTHLYLHDNELSGAIPPELGALRQLQVLYVENKQLHGTNPSRAGPDGPPPPNDTGRKRNHREHTGRTGQHAQNWRSSSSGTTP